MGSVAVGCGSVFGSPAMSVGQIWCVPTALPDGSMLCRSLLGGFGQLLQTDFGTGDKAFGTGKGSLNGFRISGLVGNTSVYKASAHAMDAAPSKPFGEARPFCASDGSRIRRPAPRPKKAAPAAPALSTVRRDTRWSPVVLDIPRPSRPIELSFSRTVDVPRHVLPVGVVVSAPKLDPGEASPAVQRLLQASPCSGDRRRKKVTRERDMSSRRRQGPVSP